MPRFSSPSGCSRGKERPRGLSGGSGEANHGNAVDIINAKALISSARSVVWFQWTNTSAAVCIPPRGMARGWPRDRGRGSGRGVGDWNKKKNEKKDTYNDTLKLTKLPVGQFGIFFLRCLTHRISQAKPKNSPSVPPFGRLRLLREGVAGERTAGEKAKQKARVAGHRTMRQGSKQKLFAANLRHGRKVRPCTRLWRAGWSVRVQEGEPTKKARRLACFPLAPPAGLEPATPWLTVRCSTDWAKEEYFVRFPRLGGLYKIKGNWFSFPWVVSAMSYFPGPSPAKYFHHCSA